MMYMVSWKKNNGAHRLGRTLGIALAASCALPVLAGPIDEWQRASKLDTCAAYQDYAAKYPDGKLSTMARDRAVQRCKPVPASPPPVIATPEPEPEPKPASLPPPATSPAPTAAPTPSPGTPSQPPPSSGGRAAVTAFVKAYYAALDRADARAAARMWIEAPRAIRYVHNNQYCHLHRNDVTYFDGDRAVVAADVTCKDRRGAPQYWEVNLTLERVGGQWKIRTLKSR